MALRVKKATATGFCFGVKRAIDTLEKVAREHGQVETLGAVVHNRQVQQRLDDIGVSIANSIDDIRGNTVAIGAHGVSPELESEIHARYTDVINTTCPFVHRAQVAARRLVRAGFFVIIYGDANHREVKGILGWAGDRGIAMLEEDSLTGLDNLPRRLGILSQTTQIPERFTEFTKKIIDFALIKDAELRIIDTICHDIRERQRAALELANRVDLMLVIGSDTSANTNHLAELCATVTQTYLVETAEDIQDSWLQGHERIGVTGGASTASETINQVVASLESIA